MANEQDISIIIKARNEASKVINDVSKNVQNLGSSISSMVSSYMNKATEASQSFALGLAGVGTAAGFMGKSFVDAAGNLEMTRITFDTLLGSAEASKKMMEELNAFAKETPFTITGIRETALQLSAYGIKQEEIIDTMKMLGDAVGGNQEKFANLAFAFGQVNAKGKLMGQEFNQITNTGFPLAELLAKKLGKPVSEVVGNIADLGISIGVVKEVMKEATSEGGKYFNLMQSQSSTLPGILSNIGDVWTQFKESFADTTAYSGLKELAIQIRDGLSAALPVAIAKLNELVVWIGENTDKIKIFAGVIIGALVPAFVALAVSIGSTMLALAPFMLAGGLIVAYWEPIKGFFQSVWETLQQFGGVVYDVWESVKNTTINTTNAISSFFVEAWAGITSFLLNTIDNIKIFFGGMWDAIVAIFTFGSNLVTGIIVGAFELIGIDITQTIANWILWFNDFWAYMKESFDIGLSYISSMWSTVWGAISGTASRISSIVLTTGNNLWNGLKSLFNIGGEAVSKAWGGLWDGISGVLMKAMEGAKSIVKDTLNWMISKINNVINALNSVAQKGAGVVGATAPQIGTIPMLANGGIVTKPTLAMIGEGGESEAVVPLSRAGEFGFSGQRGNITINISGGVFSDANEFAEFVSRKIAMEVSSRYA